MTRIGTSPNRDGRKLKLRAAGGACAGGGSSIVILGSGAVSASASTYVGTALVPYFPPTPFDTFGAYGISPARGMPHDHTSGTSVIRFRALHPR
ncbi:hypothetical protein GCM10009677_31750 [Sphaerisporangium rubeum]